MAVIKYKDKNGEWKELTILKGDSGVAPIINPDTNTWLVWDNEQGVYVDTGVVAGVGTEDFYASTYWVFNEMASGKKVIAKALTDRRYPTNNDESFVDMADKITNMSFEDSWFARIGYTDENASALKEMIDYSYDLAKTWNPDGSTTQIFGGNTKLVISPMVDTSRCYSLGNMFNGCTALSIVPHLDTSKAINMAYMFYGCASLSTIPLLNTSNVLDTSYMFYGCRALNQVPLFDTSNVVNMSYMFYGCPLLKTIPKFNTSNVVDMFYAFSNSGFTHIPTLDTSKVTNMAYLFTASEIIETPLIDTSKATSMTYIFSNCKELKKVTLLDFSSINVAPAGIFANCAKLLFINMKNLGKSTPTTYDFSGATSWGTGSEENRQSLIDSLITYSYDRASAGMTKATIKLSATTKALLTEEEIAQITAKGFTLA